MTMLIVIFATMLSTRLVGTNSAQAISTTDSSIMAAGRLGVPAFFRSAPHLAARLTTEVGYVQSGLFIRTGQGALTHSVLSLLPDDSSFGGLHRGNGHTVGESGDNGRQPDEATRSYYTLTGYSVVLVPSVTLDLKASAPAVRWHDRLLPARILRVDDDRGSGPPARIHPYQLRTHPAVPLMLTGLLVADATAPTFFNTTGYSTLGDLFARPFVALPLDAYLTLFDRTDSPTQREDDTTESIGNSPEQLSTQAYA